MDQEQNNSSDNNVLPTSTNAIDKSGGNTVIIAVAVVIVLAILGWYVIGQDAVAPSVTEQTSTVTETTTPAPVVDAETVAFEEQAATDDITSIEADLETTDLNSLDDINQI